MTDSPGTAVQAALSGSFSVERDLAAAPDRVFACSAEPAARRRWFGVPGAPDAVHQLDFRPGGGEVSRGHSAAADGTRTRLRHSEHYVYLAYSGDGAQDVAHLKGGTRLQLNGLAAALGPAG